MGRKEYFWGVLPFCDLSLHYLVDVKRVSVHETLATAAGVRLTAPIGGPDMSSPGYVNGPLVIPDTLQVRLLWTLANGRAATNVLHAIVAGETHTSLALANALFDEIAALAELTSYAGYLSADTNLTHVDVRDVRAEHLGLFESEGAPVPGTSGDSALPEEVAFVISLRTGLTGPAHRGRIYLTGIAANALDTAGHADAGFVAAALAFVQAVNGVFIANGLTLAVGHRGHASYTNRVGHTVEAEPAGSDPVLTIAARDNIFDSQRRRK